jgi:hypothetical protein
MKKLLIITTLMVLAFAMIANATFTRVQTMGNNNEVLLDDANMFQYFSRVNDYSKLALGEFTNGSAGNNFNQFGVTWKFGSDENPWVLGTFFHDANVWEPSMASVTPYGASDWFYLPIIDDGDATDDLLPNKRIDLFYGRKLGANPFGFHLGIVNSSQTGSDSATNGDWFSEGMTKYSIGAGLTLGGGTMDVAAGVDYLTWTDKAWSGTALYDETKPTGKMSFWASLRKFHQMNPSFTLIPHAMVAIGKGGYERYSFGPDELLDFTYDLKRFGVNVGSGLQWAPTQNATCILDFGFQLDKITGEYTDAVTPANNYKENEKVTTLPYFKMGAEGEVFNWLWVRFGSTSYWNKNTYEFEPTQSKWTYNWPENSTYLGLGFVFNRLHIDCNVDPDLFTDGLYFLSGENNNMNLNISALYDLN